MLIAFAVLIVVAIMVVAMVVTVVPLILVAVMVLVAAVIYLLIGWFTTPYSATCEGVTILRNWAVHLD